MPLNGVVDQAVIIRSL